MVAAAWAAACEANQQGGAWRETCTRLQETTRAMQQWSRRVFGSIKKQIVHLKAQLVDAKERAASTGYRQEIREPEDHLH